MSGDIVEGGMKPMCLWILGLMQRVDSRRWRVGMILRQNNGRRGGGAIIVDEQWYLYRQAGGDGWDILHQNNGRRGGTIFCR